jgi:NAD(P)-dependent dehydrogenase (short-subunit alcohol dehydrogenase family)
VSSCSNAWADLADRAVAALGRVDVLVNDVGVFPFGPTAQTSEADFDWVYRGQRAGAVLSRRPARACDG